MYTSLGLHWAASIPAFLSVACIPFPIIFYIYGPKIRSKCKFAAEAARVLEEMRGHIGTEDPEAAEDEAMEEVERGDRMEKLVKKMSRASGKSRTRGLSRVESGAPGPGLASEAVTKEVDNEKVDV